MSFSADIFNKKLESLQETQDSIVTISQWVLFHHRHSKETSELWSQFILGVGAATSSKKLSLLYLCNDVVQQARHKRKMEFIVEFSKVLPRVLNRIYGLLESHIKPKVDRLIKVWSERQVFVAKDIGNMKKAIEMSKSNQTFDGGETPPPPNIFGGGGSGKEGVAPELKHINNTLVHLNQLGDTTQSNLNQIGVQLKTYLPSDPGVSDNLPSPEIYISKLNVLERLCLISKRSIEEMKKDRSELLKQLDLLKVSLTEGLQADDSKIAIIGARLEKLSETRKDLQELVSEGSGSKGEIDQEDANEEPSPTFDDNTNNNNTDDDDLPTYDNNDSDDSDDDKSLPPSKKLKTSSSSPETPNAGSRKTVAFSEDVEINEYDKEDHTESIKIVKGAYLDSQEQDDSDDDDLDDFVPEEFEKHHRDDLDLKLEHGNKSHNYNQEQKHNNGPNSEGDDAGSNVLSLLSKLT